MNKKFLLSFGAIAVVSAPIISIVSCNEEKKIKDVIVNKQNIALQNKNYLVGQKVDFNDDSSSFIINGITKSVVQNALIEIEGSKQNISIFDHVDKINGSSVIAVNHDNFDVMKFIKFVTDFQPVESIYSDIMHFSFDNPNWEITNGIITKFEKDSTTKMTLTIGQVSKVFTLVNRDEIKNQNLFKFEQNAFDISVLGTAASPVGTITTEVVMNENIEGFKYNLIKTTWDDTLDISNHNSPRIDAYTSFYPKDNDQNKVMRIDSTTAHLGLLVYIPREIANEEIWWRSAYNIAEVRDLRTGDLGLDFNAQKTAQTEGWHIMDINVEGKLTAQDNFLSLIRPILLSAHHDKGHFYIGGLFQSDSEINLIDVLEQIRIK